AQWSEQTMQAYRTWLQPWVKAMGSKTLGDALRWLHPLRMQHLAFSDLNPAAPWWHAEAEQARAQAARRRRQHLAGVGAFGLRVDHRRVEHGGPLARCRFSQLRGDGLRAAMAGR